MQSEPLKKLWPQFENLSKFIKTRNACQCKSQYQRLCNRFESVPDILDFLIRTTPKVSGLLSESRLHLNEYLKKNLENKLPLAAPAEDKNNDK